MYYQSLTNSNTFNIEATSTGIKFVSDNGFTQSNYFNIYSYNEVSGDGSDNNRMIVMDDENQKGLIYYGDYTGNFTTHSLVTKGYVDAAVPNVGVDNGLQELSPGIVGLGGTLSQNTTINGSQSYSFIIDEINDFKLNFTGSATVSVGLSEQGLVYSATPSNAAPLTLIHKEYVDNQIGDLAEVDNISIILNESNQISISATISGQGLTYSSSTGIMDINWGGTSSGLTFSVDNSLKVNVDGVTIIVNDNGELKVVSGSAQPVYDQFTSLATSGDNQQTGATLSYIPNNYSRIQVYVNGQLQRLGDGVTSSVDCYFDSSGKSLNTLTIGDELYWNGLVSGFDLSIDDKIDIIYES
jgi:hypothetical protein